ncbi:MAG: glycosyltransferase family 4 protein [Candidatus Obscuribacterales bacterium]|nr:glycosyltransferase family 4 protein [Candidatus Obscuribacterales bacterium]
MRISYLTHQFYPDIGGMEVSALRTLPLLRQRDVEILVVCGCWDGVSPQETVVSGMTVVRLPMLSALANADLRGIKSIRAKLQKLENDFHSDLFHYNVGTPALLFFQSRQDKPTLITLHGTLTTGRSKLTGGMDTLLSKSLHNATWINGVSKYVLADARSIHPDITDKSTVIYHGIESEKSPSEISFDPPILLCLSRLVEEKGIELAIDAVGLVRKDFPDCRLLIAGDGPLRAELEIQARKLPPGAVQLLGLVPPEETLSLIEQSSIVLVPSIMDEGFGQVAIEAAIMARPTVTTGAGGLSEAVEHEKSGLLVERDSVEALASAVLRLLKDPDSARALGVQARLRCQDKFDLSATVDQYESLYRRLVAETAPCHPSINN